MGSTTILLLWSTGGSTPTVVSAVFSFAAEFNYVQTTDIEFVYVQSTVPQFTYVQTQDLEFSQR
jgi:hypothetical protein